MTAPTSGFHSRFSVERMIRIHDRLRDGASLNCTQFAREIQVSRKTIQRDIDHMRYRLGLPIDYDRTRHSYVYTEEVEAFPTLQMSEGDAFALVVAEGGLKSLRGTTFLDRLQSTFAKLTASLPGTAALAAEDQQSVSFAPLGEGRTNSEAFDRLQKAQSEQLEVTFSYKKPDTTQLESRRVCPYHLTHRDNLWYVVGYDGTRQDIRTFALPRMSQVTVTNQKFKTLDDFDPTEFFDDALGVVVGKGTAYDIHIQFSAAVAERIEERIWHQSQGIEPCSNGGVDLHLRLGSLVEVERWVLKWGADAKVVSPIELADRVAATATAIVHRYRPPAD